MDKTILRIENRKYLVLIILIILNMNTLAIAAESSFVERHQEFTKKDSDISPTEFRIHLQGITEFGAGTIEKASDNIIALSDDPTVKKNALMWKMTAIPIMYKIFSYPKSLKAGIDIWAFCIQMKQYFQSVDSQKAFGELNLIGFESAVQIESKIVQLAKLVIRNGDISNAENFIDSWAKDNPIQLPLFVRSSIIPILSSGIGEETLGTFETVSELSSQIDDITNMLTIYGNHIPKQGGRRKYFYRI